MIWNLKYSGTNHNNMKLAPGASAGVGGNGYGMIGMMGGYDWDGTTPPDVSSEMTVTPEQAIAYAQQYLDANISGATVTIDPIQFYGYYTLDFERDGEVAGMLSINSHGGQFFLHTWPSTFVEEAELLIRPNNEMPLQSNQ